MNNPATATPNAPAAPKQHVLDFRAYRVEKKEKKAKEDAKKIAADLKKLEKEEKKREKEEGEPPRPAPQIFNATQTRNKRKRAAEKKNAAAKKAAEKKAADVEAPASEAAAAAAETAAVDVPMELGDDVVLPHRPVARYLVPSAHKGRWCALRKCIVYDK